MPGATLEAEWSLLLAACSQLPPDEKAARLRLLSREPIHWKSLFDLADRHGVIPLLCRGLASSEDIVPSAEFSILKRFDQAYLHKALFLSRELIRILDCISTIGVEAMPYKGLPLAEIIYDDIALRQAGDIDLLIRPNDFPRARDAVRKLGYIPHLTFSPREERAYLKSGYECAFDGPAGPNLLEMQWAVQPRFYATDFDMNRLFERAASVIVAGYPIKTPSSQDLFLILAAHAAKHVWSRMIWTCDIAHIMALPALDWGVIGSQAKVLGLVRIARTSMLLANRLLDAPIPAAAQANLPHDAAASALAQEVQSRITSSTALNVESLAYFRLMLRLRERPMDRLRFLTLLAFTPGPSEWRAVRLPAPLFPLYRLIRLCRMSARLFS